VHVIGSGKYPSFSALSRSYSLNLRREYVAIVTSLLDPWVIFRFRRATVTLCSFQDLKIAEKLKDAGMTSKCGFRAIPTQHAISNSI
jgi:hypothetical protein